MKRTWFRWWWLLLLIPVIIGLARLKFDVDVLDLLPANVPAVQGLKMYQEHFANSRELILTIQTPTREATDQAAKTVSEALRHETNLVSDVTWQPPWLEHPEQAAELIAFLWLNQPPEQFKALSTRLADTNLSTVLAATREQLTTTLSPAEIAQSSYDPFGLTRLPESVAGSAPGFAQGGDMFTSADGTFRMIFLKARGPLIGYKECTVWFDEVKRVVRATLIPASAFAIGYTGRPAFVAEISASMRRDIVLSTGGTSVIIAILFWIAHRRIKPMLWLLTLLALILAATLALGGLVFGSINVISMGFAAILLGLAVDYAVVHYQEALAHPQLSIPRVRRAIAPSIFWAAVTTISAFLVLNFGGLPGLAQLGSLVGIGVALAACVMIFAFLPPLFPDRMPKQERDPSSTAEESMPGVISSTGMESPAPVSSGRQRSVFAVTSIALIACAGVLSTGLPQMDTSANALRPRDSQAYATLDVIKTNLGQKREPLWLVVAGANESEVARRLDSVTPALDAAVSNRTLSGFMLPTALWPRPEFQASNRQPALELSTRIETWRAEAATAGFSEEALGLAKTVLTTWQRAAATTNTFWPTNQLGAWIFDKLAARESNQVYAVGFIYPSTNSTVAMLAQLDARLPREGIWLSGWELLGGTVLAAVKGNLWKLVFPMAGLILLSLWLAFRRWTELLFSLGILLLSGVCLLTVMKLVGWQWNLLNLLALPLILGTGVDYSIFMQLTLRRCHGDLALAHQSVGRALLLCGGTAIAGFGSLGLSSNAGMSSLGQVCAVGIAANMLISVFLLPVWWRSCGGAER